MNFASDNIMGASAPVLEALVRANSGPLPAYGADEITARIEKRFSALFEREVQTFLTATGTGANALALSAIVPPYGLAVSHVEAHVIDDECGAPEFYMHGAKMAGLPGVGAKIAPATLETFLASLPRRVKQMPASGLSISQATESGLVYAPAEIAALSEVAHRNGLKVHMDGARFANALVALGCTPAEMTWKCGVDILTFGATKNGCLAAEAIVVFDPALAETLGYRRKRGGHLLSKGRLLSAQLEGYFENDHWLANARHANAMAARLSRGLTVIPGVRLAWPTEANEVFAIMPRALDAKLKAAGANYHPWSELSLPESETVRPDEILIRLVTAFATTEGEIERFLAAAGGAARREAAE
jgi:threonine aldolase